LFCLFFSRDRITDIFCSNSINQVPILNSSPEISTYNSSIVSSLSSILFIGLTCFICCYFAQFSNISVPKYEFYNFKKFEIVFANLLNFCCWYSPLWVPRLKIWTPFMQNTVCYLSIMKTGWLRITN
jgi:hypothetical protein